MSQNSINQRSPAVMKCPDPSGEVPGEVGNLGTTRCDGEGCLPRAEVERSGTRAESRSQHVAKAAICCLVVIALVVEGT